ncbi:GntR family transcriptional regulator [Streptomyces sp. B6B3]|uniref:GntR family transcriptional regulator n=1 Tax=Streptomyces sp. B6B3 TaxID=3153570 RepID=UPI00325F2DCD
MAKRINPSDPTPAYLQIAGDLRRAISDKELEDGDQLPSLRSLMADYGAASGTVRQALDQLQNEGLIIARQGQGVFVRMPRRLERRGTKRHLRSARPSATAPLEAEAQAQGFVRGQQLLEVATVPAPESIAQRLGIEPGTQVLVRRHLLTLDEEPAQLADSYFHVAQVEGSRIARNEKIPGGVHAELASVLGTPLTHASEELIARMPTPGEAIELRLPRGTPVVELLRTIYASDDPVEATRFLFDGSRHTFTYDVPLD